MLTSLKLSLTIVVTLIRLYVILQEKHILETVKGHCAGPNVCLLLSEFMRRHGHSILNRLLVKTSFHCVLSSTFVSIFVHFTCQ